MSCEYGAKKYVIDKLWNDIQSGNLKYHEPHINATVHLSGEVR